MKKKIIMNIYGLNGAKARINDKSFLDIVVSLRENDFYPILYSLADTWVKRLGIKPVGSKDYTHLFYNHYYDGGESLLRFAEIFTKDQELFFLYYYDHYFEGYMDSRLMSDGLNIFVISNKRTPSYDNFELYRTLINDIVCDSEIMKEYAEEETEANFDWYEPNVFSDTFEEGKLAHFLEVDKSYRKVSFTEAERLSSYILGKETSRECAKLIARLKTVRKEDLINKFNSLPISLKDIELEILINELINNDLIEEKAIVKCIKKNVSLLEIASKKELKDKSIGELKCGTCGRLFKDERIEEIYTVTELCRNLLKSSHWMTVFVTDKILNTGIDSDNIIWNLIDKSEEVDIAVKYANETYLFELKDSDFDSGHAYPLNYRRDKFNATRTVVVTTKKVSKEAIDFFESVHSIQSENDQEKTHSTIPIYIEGLDNVDKGIEEVIIDAHTAKVDELINEFESFAKIGLREIIFTYYSEMSENE